MHYYKSHYFTCWWAQADEKKTCTVHSKVKWGMLSNIMEWKINVVNYASISFLPSSPVQQNFLHVIHRYTEIQSTYVRLRILKVICWRRILGQVTEQKHLRSGLQTNKRRANRSLGWKRIEKQKSPRGHQPFLCHHTQTEQFQWHNKLYYVPK